MRFTELALTGAFLIDLERLEDDRGFFARSFCRHEFERRGMNPNVVQCNVSFNRRRGTLRGMHYQVAPRAEAKLVRCVRGALYDVIIDLRPESTHYCEWLPVHLSAADYRMLYVPEGFAHGFQTLEPDTEVFYQMSECFVPECGGGIRWDDPAFKIEWPLQDVIVSERDRRFPDFRAGSLPVVHKARTRQVRPRPHPGYAE
jgi:dTDP-4-dehydrorhamnose 3,5-epimerase